MIKKQMILLLVFLWTATYAASCTLSQAGADAGTIMQGKTFTVSVTSLSGSGTAHLILPSSGFTIEEDTTKTYSSSSISWSTVKATELTSNQEITVSLNSNGDVTTVTCNPHPFDVVAPPYLSVTHSPASTSLNAGETFEVSLNIENTGGTTASTSIGIGGTGMSIVSENIPDSIPAGGIGSGTLTIKAATAGTQTATITLSALNGNAVTKSISVSVAGTNSESDDGGSSGSSSTGGGGGTVPTTTENQTTTQKQETAQMTKIIQIQKGKPTEINITIENTVKKIRITKGKSGLVQINFEKLSSRPDNIPAPHKNTLEYLKIEASNDNIEEAEFEFEIEKSFFIENHVDPHKVVMLRWHDNKWQELETKYLGLEGNVKKFIAKTPGFSVFAISYEQEQQITPSTTSPTNQTIPQKNQQQEVAQNFWEKWILRALILLALLAVVFASYLVFRVKVI